MGGEDEKNMVAVKQRWQRELQGMGGFLSQIPSKMESSLLLH